MSSSSQPSSQSESVTTPPPRRLAVVELHNTVEAGRDTLVALRVIHVEVDDCAAVAAGVELLRVSQRSLVRVDQNGLVVGTDGNNVAALALFAELAAVRTLTVTVMQRALEVGRQLLAAVARHELLLRLVHSGLDFLHGGLVALRNQEGNAVLRRSAFLNGTRGEEVAVGKTDLTSSDLSRHSINLL